MTKVVCAKCGAARYKLKSKHDVESRPNRLDRQDGRSTTASTANRKRGPRAYIGLEIGPE